MLEIIAMALVTTKGGEAKQGLKATSPSTGLSYLCLFSFEKPIHIWLGVA